MVSYAKSLFENVLSYVGLYKKTPSNILILGLNNSGKITLQKSLQSITKIESSPQSSDLQSTTEQEEEKIRFHTFDLGANESVDEILSEHFPKIDGIFFLVDLSDPLRFPEAKEQLDRLFNVSEIQNIPIVILGTKSDKKEAVPEKKIKDTLNINEIFANDSRPMEFFMCSSVNNTGYQDALKWLISNLKENRESS
jgi:GTP-binding protein SAR1